MITQPDELIHITLIHGTFAPNAPWTKHGSALRDHFQKELGTKVVFHDDFQWSGWPSHLARHRAGERLRDYLLKLTEREPGRHFVIGHSHGGMVSLYALRDQALGQKIEGLVTLATPFLVARSRQLSILGWIAAGLTAIGLFLGVAALAILPAYRYFSTDAPPDWRYLLMMLPWIFVAVVLASAAAVAASFFLPTLTGWFLQTLALPRLNSERVLIVRGPSDEAGVLITLFHGIELIITAIWGRRGPLDNYMKRKAMALGDRLDAVLSSKSPVVLFLGWWVVAGLPFLAGVLGLAIYGRAVKLIYGESVPWYPLGNGAIDLTAWEYLSQLPQWSLVGLGIVLLPWIVALGTLSGLGTVAGLIILPVAGAFVAAVACAAVLALPSIPELGPCAVTIIVSPEATPPGTAKVCQVDTSSSEDFLLHSLAYTHPAALKAMSDTIRDWTKSARLTQAVVLPEPKPEPEPESDRIRREIARASRRDYYMRKYDYNKRKSAETTEPTQPPPT